MKVARFSNCVSALALVTALAAGAPAVAQQAPTQQAEPDGLEVVIVTASGGNRTQINSSVSVTTVNAQAIADFKPSSESELLRMIPGIQVAGTAGPGGNSNIAVRGLPVATGGSPFVQIQEDGLPTVLFGDIQFGNNDYWTRFDASVANVEGVRGGSASTYASQAPGAVINYISNTGAQKGGYVQLNTGLGFDENRLDFRYGSPISDQTRFHIGGFVKKGAGPLDPGYDVSNSYQIKGNLTHDFADDKGFFRVLFKIADTQEPNYTGSPALATISGKKVSNIKAFPGFDGRKNSNYSVYNKDFLIFNRDGVLERVAMDGITTKATALGGQLRYNINDNWSVDNNFRWTDMSGGFASPFLNVTTRASIIGSTISRPGLPNATVASIRYAAGPRAGQTFTDTYVDNNVNVRTNIRDIGSTANDFKLTGKYDTGFGALTARVGYFYMKQDIAMDWHVNKSLREVNGNNPSQLDLFDAAGNKLTQEGISGYNNNWGDCCARDYDLSYTNTAPYIALELDAEKFALDGSVRFESVKARGTTVAGGSEFLVNSGGVQIATIRANGARERLGYTRDYTSWSVGALYKVNEDTSLFVRSSKGGRFNGDRQTVSGKINADGSLTQAGRTASVDFVNQDELGLKNRGDLLGGRYTLELTLLQGDFKQSTFELSATRCPGGAGGCVIDAKYESSGAEAYATYRNGPLSVIGNATYSNAKISRPTSTGGSGPFTRAPGIPDLSFTVAANYDLNDKITLGVSSTGQTSSIDDAGREYPGAAILNATAKYQIRDNIELSLSAYNLFNKFDLRGNGGVADPTVNPTVISGNPALGRTVTAAIRYTF
ncbi:vitamin B12 transporter BtuB [Candidatus Phycosocius bacilliformis]|uniref:Vitamin B12 transporter BtuB n=1 Tax=Candidatus Phycosocius bacilliformis TaxID=1445552 RepID=A0A2P2EE43_9PROT|nr:TonB-dependent receptor [Candidatus Phycosocius bacilliformis]GBF59330.1 vitamin B12 transporter BtuB [Candidatus Phycosocius bacilliformis]